MVEVSQSEYDAICLAMETRAKLRQRSKSNKLTLAEKSVILAQVKGLDALIRGAGLTVNDAEYNS